MKLFNVITLLACTIASVYASGGEANNEMTFYGCPEECSAQRRPSCPQFDDDNLPSHFAALSTKLSHYDDYCGHYAVYMMADGNRSDKLARAVVVDSCSSCAKYHLDLSKTAFGELREHTKGTGKIIWGIYTKKGERLAGPFYNSVSGISRQLSMSEDSFISSFDSNARSLASSSHNSAKFSSSGKSDNYDSYTSKKTTSSRTTTSSTTSSTTRSTTRTTTRTTRTTTRWTTRSTTRSTTRTTTTRYITKFPPKRVTTKTLPITRKPKTLPVNIGYSNSKTTPANPGYINTKTIPINIDYSNSKTLPVVNSGYSNNSKSLPVNPNSNTKALPPSYDNGIINNTKSLPPSYDNGITNNTKSLPPSLDNGITNNTKSLPSSLDNGITNNTKSLPSSLDNGITNDTKTLPEFGNTGFSNTDTLPAKTLPNDINNVNQATATFNLITSAIPTQTSNPSQISSPTVSNNNKEKEPENKKSNMDTTIGILAIGGGCIGAAGVGLLLLKKKSPSTYEGMKQKFPEAFSTVKRSLSHRATSIKRGLSSRRSPNDGRFYV